MEKGRKHMQNIMDGYGKIDPFPIAIPTCEHFKNFIVKTNYTTKFLKLLITYIFALDQTTLK